VATAIALRGLGRETATTAVGTAIVTAEGTEVACAETKKTVEAQAPTQAAVAGIVNAVTALSVLTHPTARITANYSNVLSSSS